MKKVIGTITTCDSDEHPYLRGYRVKIIAIMKDCDDEESDDAYITDDDDLRRAGGITAKDRIEVQPWIESKGRFSFASSDPLAEDLACFSTLASKE